DRRIQLAGYNCGGRATAACYLDFLRRGVGTFSPAQQERLTRLLGELSYLAAQRADSLTIPWPDSVLLLRGFDAQYGPYTYYTRGRAVVILPTDLAGADDESLRRILLHEIFHLISRRRAAARPAAYALVGFEPLDTNGITLPAAPARRRLLNPDALDLYVFRYDDSTRWLPLDYAATPAPRPGFAAAFTSNYFLLDSNGRSGSVVLNPAADSTFQVRTGGNTDYIIHPEEILAENFVSLLLDDPATLSPDARALHGRMRGWLAGLAEE
ncbi:MAG: hypothetical protein WBA17_13070, partial [Saprospiraceae bacterium]